MIDQAPKTWQKREKEKRHDSKMNGLFSDDFKRHASQPDATFHAVIYYCDDSQAKKIKIMIKHKDDPSRGMPPHLEP